MLYSTSECHNSILGACALSVLNCHKQNIYTNKNYNTRLLSPNRWHLRNDKLILKGSKKDPRFTTEYIKVYYSMRLSSSSCLLHDIARAPVGGIAQW